MAQSEPPEPPLLIEPPFEPPSEPPAVAPFFRHILSGRKYPKNLANTVKVGRDTFLNWVRGGVLRHLGLEHLSLSHKDPLVRMR